MPDEDKRRELTFSLSKEYHRQSLRQIWYGYDRIEPRFATHTIFRGTQGRRRTVDHELPDFPDRESLREWPLRIQNVVGVNPHQAVGCDWSACAIHRPVSADSSSRNVLFEASLELIPPRGRFRLFAKAHPCVFTIASADAMRSSFLKE